MSTDTILLTEQNLYTSDLEQTGVLSMENHDGNIINRSDAIDLGLKYIQSFIISAINVNCSK
jgi:hypothetical protein